MKFFAGVSHALLGSVGVRIFFHGFATWNDKAATTWAAAASKTWDESALTFIGDQEA